MPHVPCRMSLTTMPVKKEEKKRVGKTARKPREVKLEKVVEVAAPEIVAAAKPQEEVVDEFNFVMPKTDRYFEAVGRRKTAVARIRLFTKGETTTVVNERPFKEYFPTLELQTIVEDPLKKMKSEGRFRVSAKVSGGGIHAQAEAIRLGISRALTVFNPEFRKRLKRSGLLTRDARQVERKKFGLKKARRAPQWQKR